MKSIRKITAITLYSFMLSVKADVGIKVNSSNSLATEEKLSVKPFTEIHRERINRLFNSVSDVQLKTSLLDKKKPFSQRFKSCLETLDFGVSKNAGERIELAGQVWFWQLGISRKDIPSPKPGTPESETLEVAKFFLSKINSSIDEVWINKPIPPYPGAWSLSSSGMIDKIEDEEVRKKYIEQSIANEYHFSKNLQQRQLHEYRSRILEKAADLVAGQGEVGWTHEQVYGHFAQNDKCKSIIDSYLKARGL